MYSSTLWTDYEYARKACDRTGAQVHFAINPLEFGPEHPHAKRYTKVAIPGLLPYLDDYIMGDHDPFVEDFHWSMDDNWHTESKSPELTEGDVPRLLLFADRDVGSELKQQVLRSKPLDETPEASELSLRLRSSVIDRVSELDRCCGRHCLQARQLSPPIYSEAGRAEDAAPHHEPDITYHDAC